MNVLIGSNNTEKNQKEFIIFFLKFILDVCVVSSKHFSTINLQPLTEEPVKLARTTLSPVSNK